MRCFTVLLACGWLFLLPPEQPNVTPEMRKAWDTPLGKLYDSEQPLTKWVHIASFDTAAGCEHYKKVSIERFRAAARDSAGDNEKVLHAIHGEWLWGLGGRCLPSDMLRPEAK